MDENPAPIDRLLGSIAGQTFRDRAGRSIRIVDVKRSFPESSRGGRERQRKSAALIDCKTRTAVIALGVIRQIVIVGVLDQDFADQKHGLTSVRYVELLRRADIADSDVAKSECWGRNQNGRSYAGEM